MNNAISMVVSAHSLYVKNPNTDFSRNRKLNLSTMIHLILSMQGNSLSKELYDYFKSKTITVTPSAFVQQRDKIKPELFKALFDIFNSLCNDNKTYKGYHLYAVDGSDINIPTNPESKDTYFEQGFNQFHLNALYDVMNKTYLDCIIQPARKEHEIRAAIEMVCRNNFPERSILIADRGYESENLYEYINRKPNLDYLIRIKNAGTKQTRNLPLCDLDIDVEYEIRTTQTKEDQDAFASGKAKWISGKSKFGKTKVQCNWDFESPFTIKHRFVRFEISPGEYETIVTSLSRKKFPLDGIKKLYHMRWGIETSFRELKYAIGLVNFHAKKETSILQEIYALLTMYNFCERITLSVVISQSPQRKYEYQVNFTMAIYICRDFFANRINGPPRVEELIKQYILPVRKGRKDKRKIRHKHSVYFMYRVA